MDYIISRGSQDLLNQYAKVQAFEYIESFLIATEVSGSKSNIIRVTNSLGTYSDIEELFIIDNEQLKIIASNKNRFNAKELDKLPSHYDQGEIKHLISTGDKYFKELNDNKYLFGYRSDILSEDRTSLRSISILILTSPDSINVFVSNFKNNAFGQSIFIFVSSLLLFYLMLRGILLNPIKKIILTLSKGKNAEKPVLCEVQSTDELGILASTYNSMILERHEQTQALISSEEVNRTIIENADAVITINDKGLINLFSPAAQKMFGYSREEVVGKNVKMLMPEPYHAEHDGYLHHHQQTGEQRIIGIGREVTGKRKDSSTFPLRLSVGKGLVNGEALFVGTLSDLTEIKKNEQALRDFKNRLDLATRSGGIGVWDYDVISGELVWDDRMFELYGVYREQFPGAYQAWLQALHPDDLERAESELQQAINGGEPFDTEFRISLPDGQLRFLHATATVIFDEKMQAVRMIGTNMDITAQKRSEEVLREATEAAEAANQQKSAFLNVMSHELRSPLTVILGYLPVLKNSQQPPSPELVAQIADDMNSSGQHLLAMINDLLDISKIEAGQMQLNREQINIQPLVLEIMHRFEHQAEQKGIRILSDIEDFSFQGDELRLRQVFINLVSNALKFTHEGSITISANKQNDRVTFKVTDTGIGIADVDQPYIFDTFQQVDNTSTRKAGGSGLGLAICKKLVELHGGTIEVASKRGFGTTFTFTIN